MTRRRWTYSLGAALAAPLVWKLLAHPEAQFALLLGLFLLAVSVHLD